MEDVVGGKPTTPYFPVAHHQQERNTPPKNVWGEKESVEFHERIDYLSAFRSQFTTVCNWESTHFTGASIAGTQICQKIFISNSTYFYLVWGNWLASTFELAEWFPPWKSIYMGKPAWVRVNVIASGSLHTIRELVQRCGNNNHLGNLSICWYRRCRQVYWRGVASGMAANLGVYCNA